MNNKKTVLALILLAGMLAGSALSALDFEAVFPVFLTGLTEKHEELKNLAMPDVDIRTVPEIDDQARVSVRFQKRRRRCNLCGSAGKRKYRLRLIFG
jgi:hypothetical protein